MDTFVSAKKKRSCFDILLVKINASINHKVIAIVKKECVCVSILHRQSWHSAAWLMRTKTADSSTAIRPDFTASGILHSATRVHFSALHLWVDALRLFLHNWIVIVLCLSVCLNAWECTSLHFSVSWLYSESYEAIFNMQLGHSDVMASLSRAPSFCVWRQPLASPIVSAESYWKSRDEEGEDEEARTGEMKPSLIGVSSVHSLSHSPHLSTLWSRSVEESAPSSGPPGSAVMAGSQQGAAADWR